MLDKYATQHDENLGCKIGWNESETECYNIATARQEKLLDRMFNEKQKIHSTTSAIDIP